MPRIRLLHVNVVIWAALLLLALIYHDELDWGRRALPAELLGEGYPRHPQWILFDRAQAGWSSDAEPAELIELLERSLAIEPNVPPMVLLGDVHFLNGDYEQALELFRRAVALDPASLPGRLRLAETHKELGQPEQRLVVLRAGVDYFSKAVEDYVPQIDESVWEGYNEKAEDVHDDLTAALRMLEARVRVIEQGEELFTD